MLTMLDEESLVISMTNGPHNSMITQQKILPCQMRTIENCNKSLIHAKKIFLDEAGMVDVDSIIHIISKCEQLYLFGDEK